MPPDRDHMLETMLSEIRELRRETQDAQQVIFTRINAQNNRIRHLEVWRGKLIGLASAIAIGTSVVVNLIFRRN